MNKNLTVLLLACSVGVGTYFLAGPSGAQEGPPQEEEVPETSIFVCSPYPDPACFEGLPEEAEEEPREGQEDLEHAPAATAPPAEPRTSWTLPHTT